jgi:hypothetical protein
MRQHLTKLCCALFLATAGTTSSAQESWIKGLPDGVNIDLQPKQLFFLFTSGTPKPKFDANNKPVRQKPIKEYGTGFAIADKVLITAKHVTRSASDFLNQSSDEKVKIPKRKVEFSFPVDSSRNADIEDPNSDVWVTPSPVVTTDAARVDLDTETVTPFPLSVCPIEEGEDYFLLKFRQSGEGNAKNLNVPIVVPLKADVDVTARLGNLRRFEVKTVYSEDNLDRPIGGDSGSPILDASGQVIGLLSAIQGDSYLWVTPTLAFYDLVPPKARHLADCNSEVTFDDLNKARDGLAGELTVLETRLADATAQFDQQMAAASALLATQATRIETLQSKLSTLESNTRALEAADVGLLETDEKLGAGLQDTDLLATSVMTIMLLEADKRGLPREAIIEAIKVAARQNTTDDLMTSLGDEDPEVVKKIEEIINQLSVRLEEDPVSSTVDEILAEMSKPTWEFWITPNVQGLDQPVFNIAYEREISRPLVTREMVFCMRPMFELNEDSNRSELAHLDPTRYSFYSKSNEVLVSSGEWLTNCVLSKQLPQSTKSARYQFELDVEPFFNPDDHKDLNTDEQARRFYGYAIDYRVVRGKKSGEKILHRVILELPEDADSQDLTCYYFPQLEGNDPLDDLATFASVTDADEKETYKCPTL